MEILLCFIEVQEFLNSKNKDYLDRQLLMWKRGCRSWPKEMSAEQTKSVESDSSTNSIPTETVLPELFTEHKTFEM